MTAIGHGTDALPNDGDRGALGSDDEPGHAEAISIDDVVLAEGIDDYPVFVKDSSLFGGQTR